MKRMKRIASILLAVVMALGLTMTALAADNNEWTIKVDQNDQDKTVHTYEAYQIFAGNLATVDEKRVLSNIEWGSGVDGTKLLAALKGSDKFEDSAVTDGDAAAKNLFRDCEDAADVAAVVSKFDSSDKNNAKMIDDFATIVGDCLTTPSNTVSGAGDVDIKVVGSGYYLVKDKDGSVVSGGDASVSGGDAAANGAYTRFLLQVIDNNIVVVKSEVPTGDKQTYMVNPDGTTYVPSDANYGNIGSHVSYVVTSTVPNHTGYDYYYFIMNDTLSEGLTFDGASSVRVTVGGTEITQGTDYYVYTENIGSYTFRLAFADVMKYNIGAEIKVTYSATVNEDAKVGTVGNPNTWSLQYSNNPNHEYDGTQDQTRPGLPADEDGSVFGKTPDEKTLTFLTELDITKYKDEVGENNKLEGAEFTLTGISYQVVLKDITYYEKSDNGTYYLLKDGTYTETPPTGTTYVEIGVGTKDTTTGYLRRVENGVDVYYVPDDDTEYEGATLYKLVRGTNSTYMDVNTKYIKVDETEEKIVPVQVSMEVTSDENGKVTFTGLGAGEYTLTETVTPDGYNTIEPMQFTIKFEGPAKVSDGTEGCKWTFEGKDGFAITTVNDAAGNGATATANVINVSGTLLPSTGGIGTTIFYVVGSILVLAAVVLLVAKKRMSAEK